MFYDRLNHLCRLHGTNITEVATVHLGVANSAPTSWKKGASPRAEVVIRAAEHFGVSADYLLGLTDVPLPLRTDAAAEEVQSAAVRLAAASWPARRAAIAAMEAVIASLDAPDAPEA